MRRLARLAPEVDDFSRELARRQRRGTTPDQIEITHYGDGTTSDDRALAARSDVNAEAAPRIHDLREVPPDRPV